MSSRPASGPGRAWLTLALAGGLVVGGSVARAAEQEPESAAVAMVFLLEGEATAEQDPGMEPRSVELLDRVGPGMVVRTSQASRLVVTYFDGQRFELGPESAALVAADQLEVLTGDLRMLEPVDVVPALSPIARDEEPGRATAAARLRRDQRLSAGLRLDPYQNAVVRADHCVLRFSARAGVRRYSVRIEDEALEPVLETEDQTGLVRLPPGTLEPGAEYYWRVCPLSTARVGQCEGAVFTTLSQELTDQRSQLELQAMAAQAPDLLILLARLDVELGLLDEACAGIEMASRLSRDQRALEKLLLRFQCEPGLGIAEHGPISDDESTASRPSP